MRRGAAAADSTTPAATGGILPVCGKVHPARRPLSHAVRRRSFAGRHRRVAMLHRPLDKEGFMPSDRRVFLGAGLGVTAVLASRAGGLTTAAQAVSSESSPLPGHVSLDPEVRAA